jgi:phosphoribulokinase
MPKNRKVQHPIILGVVGDSAAGKSTISAGIAQILGPERVVVICSDDYHRYSRAERAKNGISALDPRANYIDILELDIQRLRNWQPILKPVYNHDGGTLDAPEYIEPKEYVILEGLLGYATRAMRANYDVKIYLEPTEDLRRTWKIQRDTAKRGYTVEEVLKSMEKRKFDSVNFIQPQRTFADMVVAFYRPEGKSEESGAHLNACHILRPTLPHPDLTPILEAGGKKGLRLELARDIDGKPVDVLEISGDIDDKRAQSMEDLIWGLIPEARHLRENVGRYMDDKNRPALSHPLALSQLLITYHMVKAALGHHAV